MVTLTRRRALQGVAGSLVGLAGCAGDAGEDTDTAGQPGGRRYENVERDPESVSLRTPTHDPAAWLAPEGTEAEDPTEDRRLNRPEDGLIADRGTADRLRYADVPGTEDAERFVAETDFESATLLLDSRAVGECYELRLCRLTWSRSEYHTWYLRTDRPADVACETDDDDQVLFLIRIPDALDPDAVTGSGSGLSTQGCWTDRRFRGRSPSPTDTNGTSRSNATGGRNE